MVTKEERIRRAIRKYPERSNYHIARNLYRTTSVEVASVRQNMTGLQPEQQTDRSALPLKEQTSPSMLPVGRSMVEFQRQHDPETLIDAAIKQHLSRRGHYFTDQEFRELCGVNLNRWRRFADLEKYRPYRFVRGKFNNWAHPEDVLQMMRVTGF